MCLFKSPYKYCAKLEEFLNKYQKSVDLSVKIIEIVIALIITGALTNQLIHPLFSPRVSNIDIAPLFIQSDDGSNYYVIYKLLYNIEVPLIPEFPIYGSNKIEVTLPSSTYRDSGHSIELNANFKEVSPNVIVDIFENDSVYNYISVDKINLTITTNAWSNKVVKQPFYFRERLENIDSDIIDNIGYSRYYWWNSLGISPVIDCNVAASNYNEIAYLELSQNNTVRLLSETFKNKCNLDIKGYRPRVLDYHRVICDRENQLYESNSKLSFDLKAGEEKTIYLIDRETTGDVRKDWGVPTIEYNYSTDSCFWLWKTVRELGNY